MSSLDQHLANNIEEIINIFGPSLLLRIVLGIRDDENREYKFIDELYPLTYDKLYQMMVSEDIFRKSDHYLQFDLKYLNLLHNVTNFGQISEIMTVIKSINNIESICRTATVSFLNDDQQQIISDFNNLLLTKNSLNLKHKNNEPDDRKLGHFFNQYDDLDIIFAKLNQYAKLSNTDHLFHLVKFKDLSNLTYIKLLNSINYNFSYLFKIDDIEIFEYLYHHTNFNQTFETQKEHILNYIYYNTKVFKHIVENYLYQDIQNLIPTFNLDQLSDELCDLADIGFLEYLHQLGYDFNPQQLKFYIKYTHLDIDNIKFLITLNLSQKNIQRLYYLVLNYVNNCYFDENLLSIIYDRVMIFTESYQYVKAMSMNYFMKIIDKVQDPNVIFKGTYDLEQFNYILNHFANFDYSVLIASILRFRNDSMAKSCIELLSKYQLTLSESELIQIYEDCRKRYLLSNNFEYTDFREMFRSIIVD